MSSAVHKKLIEVALPLEAMNKESVRASFDAAFMVGAAAPLRLSKNP